VDGETDERVIVLEDLAARCHFPAMVHAWDWDEACCVLRAAARLHVEGHRYLSFAQEQAWMRARQHAAWPRDELLQKAEELAAKGIWAPLPRLDRLLEAVSALATQMAVEPMTLIHNDLCPPNVGLPLDLHREAVFVDWEMAGWGLAELDMAYMFILPFENTRQLERERALAVYWAEREALEGIGRPVAERRALQWYADALMALHELNVAHRVAHRPFVAASTPWSYWQAMFPVVHRKLRQLWDSL
jgi:thiamine kinase-like enzyme